MAKKKAKMEKEPTTARGMRADIKQDKRDLKRMTAKKRGKKK